MQAEVKSETGKLPLAGDTVTIVSVALLAYMLANVLHEGAGHAGACLAVGGRVIHVSSVDMDCSVESRLVEAAGTLMNYLAAAVFLVLGRMAGRTDPAWRYFCWISMAINVLIASGYFLFSGIGGFGDWAQFIKGLGPQWAWRIGMTVFGAAAYLGSVLLILLEMRPLIGSNEELRYRRAIELTRFPYLAGGILACVSGALNPAGLVLVALSAAASTFGGTSGLIWAIDWLKGDRIPPGSEPEPEPIRRNWIWIGAAVLCACGFVSCLIPRSDSL